MTRMSSMDFATNTEIPYTKKTFSASNLYNILFPIFIAGSIIYIIAMMFITPVEKYVSSGQGAITMKSLKEIEKTLGTASILKLTNPTKPGQLGSPIV